MKLIKCHIENFGKLKNFDFNFVDGLNSIKEENGWGKSTFATFIKCMFYGLNSYRGLKLEENERKRYTPWQGGNFGGNIEFQINDKQYKIERFFGKKDAEDTFNLIDLSTGKKSKDYTENIGEELFDLDEEAFERSSYIPQKVLDSNINESISNKLTNLIQGTTEKFNFEEAQKILDKKRAYLQNSKKTGKIQELESNLEDNINKINELKTSSSAIAEIQKLIDAQDKAINDLARDQDKVKSQIKEYSQVQQKLANQEMFKKLSKQVSSTKEEISTKQKILNNQNTSLTEIESYVSLDKSISKNEDKIKIQQENDYVKQRYKELTEYFGSENNIPTADKTKEITNAISRFNTLKETTTIVTETKSNTPKNKNKLCLLIAILSIICLIGGAVTLKFVLPLSIALFVIGAILLIASGFIYLVNMINIKTTNTNNIDYEQIQKDHAELLKLQKDIESFLIKFEDVDTDYNVAINNIISNRKEYETIKAKMESSKVEQENLSKAIKEDKLKLDKFLSKFNFEENLEIATDKLSNLKDTIIDISKLKERLVSENEELEQFKQDKNFDIDENTFKNIDINDLQKTEKDFQTKIDECRDLKSKNIAKINKIQDELSALDDLENEKENLEDDINKLNKEFKAIKNAQKFLEEANDSLSSKFLDPMKNGLKKYLKLITSVDFSNLQLDTDFNISFEEYGESRKVDYYSKGYRNTIDLCMRLALIDTLFDKEKPFIVLDDPFVNMDETKVENAKQFLHELSKSYQLIYFACHESRC